MGEHNMNKPVSQEDMILFRTVYFAGKEELSNDKVNALLNLQQLNGVKQCIKISVGTLYMTFKLAL